MAVQLYPSGAGESLGDSLLTASPLYLQGGYVWYVNSSTGVNAASPRGRDRTEPLATLAQAHTNASNGDIIVLMDGHTETITSALDVTKRVKIVGAGSSGGLPTAKLTWNAANGTMLGFSGHHCELRNVWIEENAQTCASSRINVTGDFFEMRGCYVQCGATDTGDALELEAAAQSPRIVNTTFISTATALTAQPYTAIEMGGIVDGLRMSGVVFDNGTAGFSGYWAFIDNYGLTNYVVESQSLLRGADMLFDADATGTISGVTSSMSALIEFTGSGGA